MTKILSMLENWMQWLPLMVEAIVLMAEHLWPVVQDPNHKGCTPIIWPEAITHSIGYSLYI